MNDDSAVVRRSDQKKKESTDSRSFPRSKYFFWAAPTPGCLYVNHEETNQFLHEMY
jgi:hypothetical protein